MDTNLDQIVLELVVRLWPTAEGSLSSRVVHAHLRQSGIAVPNGAMAAVWRNLMELRRVNGVLISTPGAMETHGGLTVTWVDPDLLNI